MFSVCLFGRLETWLSVGRALSGSVGLSVVESRSVGLSVCRSVGLWIDSLTELDRPRAWYRAKLCRTLSGLVGLQSIDNCRSTCRSVGLLSGYCRDSLSVCRTGARGVCGAGWALDAWSLRASGGVFVVAEGEEVVGHLFGRVAKHFVSVVVPLVLCCVEPSED